MKDILFRLNEKKTLMLLVLNLHEVFYVLKITQFKIDWFKQLILLLLFIGKNKIMLQCHVDVNSVYNWLYNANSKDQK